MSRGGPAISPVFARPFARAAVSATALVFGVALVAGSVRAAPFLLADGVPRELAAIFAKEAVAIAGETALFVGPALGAAIAARRLVERGEARALFAIGASPARIVATAWPVLAGGATLLASVAWSWGSAAIAPGARLSALVDRARTACVAGRPPSVANVPLLDASWVCLPGSAPRLVGRTRSGAAFAASSLSISSDARALEASDLEVLSSIDGASVRLRAGHANIGGLPRIVRASNLSPALRASILAVTSALVAALSAARVLARRGASMAHALALGASGPATALLVLSALEGTTTAPWRYGLVPVAGAMAVVLASAGPSAAARLRDSLARRA